MRNVRGMRMSLPTTTLPIVAMERVAAQHLEPVDHRRTAGDSSSRLTAVAVSTHRGEALSWGRNRGWKSDLTRRSS